MSDQKTTALVPRYEQDIRGELIAQRKTLAAFLPKDSDQARFGRSLILAVGGSDALQRCSPASIVAAALDSARIGLDVGGPQGHAYLIPYGQTAKLVIGYKGWLAVAKRARAVIDVETILVHEGDVFRWLPHKDPPIEHEPVFGLEDPGKVVAGYVRARLPDGTITYSVMPGYAIAKVEAFALQKAGKRSTPWHEWREEMIRKTVLSKFLRLHLDAADVAELDGADAREFRVVDVPSEPRESRAVELRAEVVSEPEPVRERAAESPPEREAPPPAEEVPPKPEPKKASKPAEKPKPEAPEPTDEDGARKAARKSLIDAAGLYGLDVADIDREAKEDHGGRGLDQLTVDEMNKIRSAYK